jgi:ABC-2 type transport system ATP-binding protein
LKAGPEPVVELVGARKDYGQTRALDGVDLRIDAGEVVAVLGPNGAGKTTAISLMLGLRQPTSGEVRLFGRRPTDLAARSRCGVMLQESGVPDLLTVRDLVRLFSSYYPRHLPAAEVIRKAGLEAKAGTRAGSLSGGQQQRLYYALAICGDPEVLFLDEPTVGLDVEGRRAFLAELKEWAEAGRTIILTTHYLEEADQLARRIVVIDRGRIIADAAPAEIKARVAGKKIVARFRGAPPRELLERLPATRLEVHGDTATMLSSQPVQLVRELMRELGDDLVDLDIAGADLEEAFVHLTSEAEMARV